MAREREKSLYVSLLINMETVSSSRNQDEKNFMIDISDTQDVVNTTITLFPNNDISENPKSTRVIEDVEKFFYNFYPYGEETEVIATFTKMDNSVFSLRLNNATVLNEPFKLIEIKNCDRTNSAAIKLIYS